MFDTMPYIYGMYNLACLYAGVGMINKAIDVAKEILKLDYQDSSGTRYLLMALYAYKEDENNLKKLYKKYPEENLHTLVPLLVYYYKQMNFDEAKKYLKKIFKCNKHFDTIFDDIDENMLEGYTLGDLSEVADTGALCSFLLNTVPALEEFVKHPDEF